MTHDENRISDLIDGGLHDKSAIDRAKYELHMRQKVAIEVAATEAWEADARHNPIPNNPYAYRNGFGAGAKEVIEHPERYDLVPAAHTATLQERVKELENELKLSEDTIKHQAERCLKLESDSSRVLNEVKEINQLAKKTRANVTLRIVELETENTRLREALEKITNTPTVDIKAHPFQYAATFYNIAKEALKNNEG